MRIAANMDDCGTSFPSRQLDGSHRGLSVYRQGRRADHSEVEMKILTAAAVALLLAGCASAPRPQAMVVPSYTKSAKAVQPAAQVIPPAPDRPATFKERFQSFRKKHPITWTHH